MSTANDGGPQDRPAPAPPPPPPPHSRPCLETVPAGARRRWLSGALCTAIVMALAWLATHHPSDAPVRLPCPSRALFGIECPGCGSTRATHFALRGEFAAAWAHNPLLVIVGIPLLAWFMITLAIAALAGRRVIVRLPAGHAWSGAWLGWAIVALLVAYMIVRNLPGERFEWLRPPEHGSHGASKLHATIERRRPTVPSAPSTMPIQARTCPRTCGVFRS